MRLSSAEGRLALAASAATITTCLLLVFCSGGSFSAPGPASAVTFRESDEWTNLTALLGDAAARRRFFAYKERVYDKRRERIAKYCAFIKSVSGASKTSRTMNVRKDSISYNPRDGISYCSIAKVG